jgi:hypothetical protein
MNEGKFPAGKSKIFILMMLSENWGYLLLRKRCDLYVSFLPFVTTCQNIYLLYNTESDGLDAEKKVDLLLIRSRETTHHNLTHEIYNAVLPETAYTNGN